MYSMEPTNVQLSQLGNQLIKCEAHLTLPGECSKLWQSAILLIANALAIFGF